MRVPAHHGRTATDVEMTPLIDVVFQLLIFFICTASFQQAEELLPMGLAAPADRGVAAPRETLPEPPRVVVVMARDGELTQWKVNERPAESLSQLQAALRAVAAADPATPVTLDVGGSVPLGDMIDVYDLCRLAGLLKVEFAVEAK